MVSHPETGSDSPIGSVWDQGRDRIPLFLEPTRSSRRVDQI